MAIPRRSMSSIPLRGLFGCMISKPVGIAMPCWMGLMPTSGISTACGRSTSPHRCSTRWPTPTGQHSSQDALPRPTRRSSSPPTWPAGWRGWLAHAGSSRRSIRPITNGACPRGANGLYDVPAPIYRSHAHLGAERCRHGNLPRHRVVFTGAMARDGYSTSPLSCIHVKDTTGRGSYTQHVAVPSACPCTGRTTHWSRPRQG